MILITAFSGRLTVAAECYGQTRQDYFKKFKDMVTTLNEEVVMSKIAVGNKYFEKYGLTDAAIIELSQKKYLVITDDFPLSNLLSSISIDVINFNHIRGYRWSIGQG